ncbi:MAG: sigma-70 family RNA polymerase sigma factor [Planctomycetota bacterium]|nr:sigma-70 family RNA polymerase sigma factor [Planctomycetota bacterium]
MQRARRPHSLADERLSRTYEAGRAAHPTVDLPFEDFTPYAQRALPKIDNGDYYLAVACELGLPAAWERLQARFTRPLRAMMRRRGAGRGDVAQLLDDVWGRLAGAPPSGAARTRIGTYDGQGPLLAWLATVAWRRLTDAWRARAGTAPLAPGLEETLYTGSTPASRAAADETERLVGDVLAKAWAALTERELEVVVLKYRHQLPQKEIARVLGISPARITRLLASAARRLRAAVRKRYELRTFSISADSNQAALLGILDSMLARSDAKRSDEAEERGTG